VGIRDFFVPLLSFRFAIETFEPSARRNKKTGIKKKKKNIDSHIRQPQKRRRHLLSAPVGLLT
jgi:hypothetical protein